MNPQLRRLLIGTGLGAGTGYGFGRLVDSDRPTRDALLGGATGLVIANGLGAAPRAPRVPGAAGASPLHAVAPWLRGVATKAEAKAKFRAMARSAHPDVGGSTRGMQELNRQWERVQTHPAFAKLAFAQGVQMALQRFGISV